MLALTLRHPWPFALCRLGKRIENRSWRPSPNRLTIGDRIAIHAGVEPRSGAAWKRCWDLARELADDFGGPDPDPLTVFRPGIVAVATFRGIVTASADPWFAADVPGNVGWVLGDVIVLPEPIGCKGAQGLWSVPDGMLPFGG